MREFARHPTVRASAARRTSGDSGANQGACGAHRPTCRPILLGSCSPGEKWRPRRRQPRGHPWRWPIDTILGLRKSMWFWTICPRTRRLVVHPFSPLQSRRIMLEPVRTTVPRYQCSPSGYLLNARLASGEPHMRACAGPSAFQRPGRKATRQRAKDRYRYGGESECPTCADAIEPPGTDPDPLLPACCSR
jgi:hypothetical protein